MIELTSGQARVARDIFEWLSEGPSSQEIESYTEHVLRADREALFGVPILMPELLFKQKTSYFTKANASEFLKIPEIDQLYYVSALGKFSTASVLQKLEKKHSTHIPSLPADIVAWSQEYLSIWEGILVILSLEDFQRQNQYLNSFVKVPATKEQLVTLFVESKKGLNAIQERYTRDLEATNEQLAEERIALSIVPFFPKEFIDNAIKDADEPSKRRLFEDLYYVSDFLINIGEERPDNVSDILHALVKAKKEREILSTLDTLQSSKYPSASKMDPFFNLFETSFSIENIQKNAVVQTLRGQGTELIDKPYFTECLYSYIAKSPLITEIVSPYEIDFLLAEIGLLKTEGDILIFLNENQIGQETPIRKGFFIPLLHELFSITHNFKEQ